MNGVCEAFVQGSADRRGLGRYNKWMLAFSAVFLATSAALVNAKSGSGSGEAAKMLIVANICKMASASDVQSPRLMCPR